MFMNAVGIDVSKGKSTVAVIQPFGVIIAAPLGKLHFSYYITFHSDIQVYYSHYSIYGIVSSPCTKTHPLKNLS